MTIFDKKISLLIPVPEWQPLRFPIQLSIAFVNKTKCSHDYCKHSAYSAYLLPTHPRQPQYLDRGHTWLEHNGIKVRQEEVLQWMTCFH